MSKAYEAHRARRAALVARAEAQRDELGHSVNAWKPVFAGADRARSVLKQAARLSPVIGAGLGVLGLLAARSQRVARVARRATSAWRTTQTVINALRGFGG